MEFVLFFSAGAAASGLAAKWYMERQRRRNWPRVVTCSFCGGQEPEGRWVILDTESDKSLEILEAKWGETDVTRYLQDFCAETSRVEFACSVSMLHTLTNENFLLNTPNSVLWIKYQ